jgi:hypothetical protein
VQPWRAETFTFSTDPELVAEVTDVVGVYLAPPQDAVVLCVDEKTEIQAWATFRSVRDLTAKIRAFIDGWNDPSPGPRLPTRSSPKPTVRRLQERTTSRE